MPFFGFIFWSFKCKKNTIVQLVGCWVIKQGVNSDLPKLNTILAPLGRALVFKTTRYRFKSYRMVIPMHYIEYYSESVLQLLLGVAIVVTIAPLKKKSIKIISLVTSYFTYLWSIIFYIYFMSVPAKNCDFQISIPGTKAYIFMTVDCHDRLFATFTILFLVIIYVELSAMSSKNGEIKKLECKKQVKSSVSESFSKRVTRFFFGTPKNKETEELELKEQAKKRASERFSKLVTLLFLVAQFWLTFFSFTAMNG
jgi:ABC-type multidrug transport system fused ATPase/permease subunit